MTVPVMYDAEGAEITCPRNPQMVFQMKLPQRVPPLSFVRHAVTLGAKE